MKKRKSNSYRKKLLNKCWKLMSLYTRIKDADEKGITKCVTCGIMGHYKTMQAGHFWHGVMDFNEININCQCVRCNKWLSGNLGEYGIYLLKKIGLNNMMNLYELRNKIRASGNKEYSLEDLEQIAVNLTLKLAELSTPKANSYEKA